MFDHRDSLGQAKTNSDKGNASRKAHFTCDGVVDRHIKIWPSDVLSVPGPVEAQNFLNPEKKAAPTPSQIRGTGIAVKTFRFKIPCIGWHIASAANAPSPSARVDRNSQGRGHTRMRWGLAPTITPMQSLDRLHWHDRRYAKPARPSVQSDRRHRSLSRDIDADPVMLLGTPGTPVPDFQKKHSFAWLGEAVPSNSPNTVPARAQNPRRLAYARTRLRWVAAARVLGKEAPMTTCPAPGPGSAACRRTPPSITRPARSAVRRASAPVAGGRPDERRGALST
jgi:hypothetical protein